jgi:hypothetical protein
MGAKAFGKGRYRHPTAEVSHPVRPSAIQFPEFSSSNRSAYEAGEPYARRRVHRPTPGEGSDGPPFASAARCQKF